MGAKTDATKLGQGRPYHFQAFFPRNCLLALFPFILLCCLVRATIARLAAKGIPLLFSF
jgi:hypothetical protein